MEEYVKMLIIDREVLSEKIDKLEFKILSEDFKKIERKERRLMCKQLKTMKKYRDILNDRISIHCTVEEDAAYVDMLNNPKPEEKETKKKETKKKEQ